MSNKKIPKKFRFYRLVLYPDNKEHMLAFRKIKRDPNFNRFYVGIWHTVISEFSGRVEMVEDGKKHCHIYLVFPNARSYSKLLDDLGISMQFCRPIGYDLDKNKYNKKDTLYGKNGAFVYLLHYNKPMSQQYDITGVFGTPQLVLAVERELVKAQASDCPMSEAVLGCLRWISSGDNVDRVISSVRFMDWCCRSKYFKASTHWAVRDAIQSHNAKIYNDCVSAADDGMISVEEAYRRKMDQRAIADLYDLSDFQRIV